MLTISTQRLGEPCPPRRTARRRVGRGPAVPPQRRSGIFRSSAFVCLLIQGLGGVGACGVVDVEVGLGVVEGWDLVVLGDAEHVFFSAFSPCPDSVPHGSEPAFACCSASASVAGPLAEDDSAEACAGAVTRPPRKLIASTAATPSAASKLRRRRRRAGSGEWPAASMGSVWVLTVVGSLIMVQSTPSAYEAPMIAWCGPREMRAELPPRLSPANTNGHRAHRRHRAARPLFAGRSTRSPARRRWSVGVA